MAKRKAARAGGRKTARRAVARKRGGARKAARARKGSVRKRSAARKVTRARKTARVARRPAAKARARKATRKASARPAGRKKVTAARRSAGQARKAPALNRERRTIGEEGIVPTPPSSLDLDRHATAARTGRRELHEKFTEHTETSPAITGGDIDADWESAYSVGD